MSFVEILTPISKRGKIIRTSTQKSCVNYWRNNALIKNEIYSFIMLQFKHSLDFLSKPWISLFLLLILQFIGFNMSNIFTSECDQYTETNIVDHIYSKTYRSYYIRRIEGCEEEKEINTWPAKKIERMC